jgi:hypothetical protein
VTGLAGDVVDLVTLLQAAGLQARDVTGDPAVPPVVLVDPPTLTDGRVTPGGGAVLQARTDLVAVTDTGDAVPFLDVVLQALVDAGVLVESATPTGYYAGDTPTNPLPAYRVTVRWPHTLTRTGGTP